MSVRSASLAGYGNLTVHKVPVSPAVAGRPAVRSNRRGHEHPDFTLRGLAPSLPYPSTTALLTRKETVRP